MAALEMAQSVLVRKLAYYTVGWAARSWYNSAFGLYWIREIANHEQIHADWRSIIRSAKADQNTDIYISAGDLWSMGPFLLTTLDDRQCRNKIGRVFIRHLSPRLLHHLTHSETGFPPLVSPTLLEHLERNLNDLRRGFGKDRVLVKEWPAFPRFHGVIFQSYLSYCPWACDDHGMLTHKTDVRFMHREHDHDLFDKFKQSILAGFEPNSSS